MKNAFLWQGLLCPSITSYYCPTGSWNRWIKCIFTQISFRTWSSTRSPRWKVYVYIVFFLSGLPYALFLHILLLRSLSQIICSLKCFFWHDFTCHITIETVVEHFATVVLVISSIETVVEHFAIFSWKECSIEQFLFYVWFSDIAGSPGQSLWIQIIST